MLVKQSGPPRNVLPKRLRPAVPSVSGAVEKWWITFGKKFGYPEGFLNSFFRPQKQAKWENKFSTHPNMKSPSTDTLPTSLVRIKKRGEQSSMQMADLSTSTILHL